jgi:hypothetical protein
MQPADNAQLTCCSVNFSWSTNPFVEFFVLQVSTSPTFDGAIHTQSMSCGVSTPSTTGVQSNNVYTNTFCMKMDNAALNGTWYWRVRYWGAGAFSEWSAPRSFIFAM